MPVADGLYYLEAGKENGHFPVVILIHGSGETGLAWPAEIRRLRGYHMIAPDLPGHGRSEGTALQSVRAYADRLARFLEELKISRAVVVGCSLGGAVALTLATCHSRVVAGLGVIAAGAFFGGETEILEHLATPFGFSRGLQIIQSTCFGSRANPVLVKSIMARLSQTRHGLLFSDWHACASFDMRAEIEAIGVPAWVAVGAEDQITPPLRAQFLVERLPQSSLQVIAGAGHMVLHEAGEEVGLGLRAFLERLDFNERLNGYREPLPKDEEQKRKNINFFSLL